MCRIKDPQGGPASYINGVLEIQEKLHKLIVEIKELQPVKSYLWIPETRRPPDEDPELKTAFELLYQAATIVLEKFHATKAENEQLRWSLTLSDVKIAVAHCKALDEEVLVNDRLRLERENVDLRLALEKLQTAPKRRWFGGKRQQ
jgi:hypothetical protein